MIDKLVDPNKTKEFYIIHQVIGLDVSKEKVDLSVYNGTDHYCKILKNTPKTLLHFVKNYQPEQLLIVMESTGIYHLRIAMAAIEQGYSVSIVNPLIIKRYGEMKMRRVKTDKADAKLIAEYGYEQEPPLFKPASKERNQLLQILKGLEDLYQSKTQMKNRLEAYDYGLGIAPALRASIISVIEVIEEQIKKLNDELDDHIEKHYPKEHQKMISINGVGKKTSSTILAYYGGFENFENSKRVISFAGINPHPRQSNRGSSISKRGHSLIRKTLYMCSLSLVRCNQEYKEYYEHLLARGKAKKQALVAVSCKLLRQLFAIVKYDREWEPYYALKYKSA